MNNKIAVLIDAENTSVKYIDVALKELKQYGDISVQRMYGDFSKKEMKSWADKGLEYAIVPIHQARYSQSKNASDIMLVIDAMDFLYQGSADIFCIITSDSDFTRVASRIREGGKKVVGMGMSNASKTFITACNEYKFLDKISEEESEDNTKDSAVTPLSDIKSTINLLIQQAESRGEKLDLSVAKVQLLREYPDFDERNYGYTMFSKFIEDETRFNVEREGNIAFVTRKNNDKAIDIKKIEQYIVSRASNKTELGALGKALIDKYPKFKYKDLGYSKLSKFVGNVNGVKIANEKKVQFVVLDKD